MKILVGKSIWKKYQHFDYGFGFILVSIFEVPSLSHEDFYQRASVNIRKFLKKIKYGVKIMLLFNILRLLFIEFNYRANS